MTMSPYPNSRCTGVAATVTSCICPSGTLREVRATNPESIASLESVSVYLTSATADLGESQPTQGAVASGGLSGYREIAQGTTQEVSNGLLVAGLHFEAH